MPHEVITKALEEHAAALQEIKEGSLSKVDELGARLADLEQKSARSGGGNKGSQTEASKILKDFRESQQFDSLRKGAPSTGRVQLEGVSLKALTNVGMGGDGASEYNIQPRRQEGLYNNPRRPLTLLDVLPSISVSVPKFEYVQLEGYTNNAAFQVHEGDEKSEAEISTVLKEANVATIAHWTKASAQVLDDAPSLMQQVGNLLTHGLLAKFEAALVAGPGGQGKIAGMLDQSAPFSAPGSLADVVGAAITELNANGWAAGLVVMNPSNWYAIASERAESGDGQYILGSPRDPAPPSLWGVPVVTTPSIAEGTVLVLDPSQVAVLDRMSPTLMASRNDGNNFTSNLVTILAEMRVGLAVFSTGAVLRVTVSSS